MHHQRHQQRAGSVSDRSLATSTRRSAPSSAALPHLLPQGGEGLFQCSISVRRRALSSIVLQLQRRYRNCVQNGGGAYIEIEKVRTESLRTKGAYISGSDVRTCNFEAVANLLRLAFRKCGGDRFLKKAISVPLRCFAIVAALALTSSAAAAKSLSEFSPRPVLSRDTGERGRG